MGPFRPLVALLVATALPGCADADVEPAAAETGLDEVAAAEPTLDEVRAATERFQDVQVALDEGYIRDPFDLCDTSEFMGKDPALGAMGIHYFRPDLLGITDPPAPRVVGDGTHTDFRSPGILLYEPQEDGSLELVAVENLVFAESWEAAGFTEPPSYQGTPYNRMEDVAGTAPDEAHRFAPHYDLHVWLYRENPGGVFSSFNPAVRCDYHTGATDYPG